MVENIKALKYRNPKYKVYAEQRRYKKLLKAKECLDLPFRRHAFSLLPAYDLDKAVRLILDFLLDCFS